MANNPLKYTDPNGHFLDWIWDVISVGYDIYQLCLDPSWGNAGTLGLDILLGIVPFVPSGAGFATKLVGMTGDALKIVTKGVKSSKIEKILKAGADVAIEKTSGLLFNADHILRGSKNAHIAGWERLVKDPTKNWDTIESLIRYSIAYAYDSTSVLRGGDNIVTYYCKIGDETIQVTVNESRGIVSDAFVMTR